MKEGEKNAVCMCNFRNVAMTSNVKPFSFLHPKMLRGSTEDKNLVHIGSATSFWFHRFM